MNSSLIQLTGFKYYAIKYSYTCSSLQQNIVDLLAHIILPTAGGRIILYIIIAHSFVIVLPLTVISWRFFPLLPR